MNVLFHTLAAAATAAVLSIQLDETTPIASRKGMVVVGAGLSIGILLHGVLDWIPHQYPLPSALDVFVSLFVSSAVLILAQKQARWLFLACFLGAILPDLIDLGPAILNKQLQWHLPTVQIFPWHWAPYSGSIYDGSRGGLSILNHLIVAGVSVLLILRFRKSLLTRSLV